MSPGTLSLVVLVPDPDPRRGRGGAELVRYCDTCRRWGRRGSPHLCGENWSEYLAPLLAELASEGRASR